MSSVQLKGSPDVDVIIVGAGISGLVLAGLLVRNHIRVAIIEARESCIAEGVNIPDPRALAITLASAQILNTLGIFSGLDPTRIGHFRNMHVWDENGKGEIHFDSAEICQPTLGYIIESNILLQALTDTLEENREIVWYRPAQVEALDTYTDRIVLALNDGRRISAALVVAADGKASGVRSLAGISFTSDDYEQQALACIVKTELAHDDVARQRFLSAGTLAFLPMSDPYQSGIVWSTSIDEAQRLQQYDSNKFHQALQTGIDYRLGDVTESGSRICYSLGYGVADSYIADRIALIGDAAHVVHPLAGQGANLGILDAAALNQTISETTARGRDIGDRPALRRYERWRKGENQLMMQVLTGFKELFTNQMFPLPFMRNLGLDITNKLPFVKHHIMQYAMGIRGDIPEVARIPV